MALPMPITAGDNIYQAQLPNLTAATVMYIPMTRPGRVKRIAAVPTVVNATGNGTIQAAYAPPGSSTFTDITNALVTITTTQAAGLTSVAEVGPSTTAYVQDGGTIRLTVGGTATGGGTPVVSVNVGV